MGSYTTIPPLLDASTAATNGTLTKVPRTLTEIDASIQASRLARPELDALSAATSTTSIFRLLEYSIAAGIWAFEKLLTRFQAEITDLVHGAPVGTLKWYVDRALEFQAGDTITINQTTNRVEYAQVDLTKRIIARAAASVVGNTVVLKVAAIDGSTQALQRLTSAQLQQVYSYFDRLRPAGIQFSARSDDADRLRVKASVYYDSLLQLSVVQAGVEAAIAGYLAGLPFDGLLLLSRLEDAIQAVPGVTDVALTEVSVRVGNKVDKIDRAYYAQAGYVVPEDIAASQLRQTITYYPQDGTTIPRP